jgi:hypothetical protein
MNAMYSTGPTTEEGKRRAALNSLRHGLTSQAVILPGEDMDDYIALLQAYTDEYKPKGPTEEQLIQTLTDTAWRLNRGAAMENNILILGANDLEVNDDRVAHSLSTCETLDKKVSVLNDLSIHTQRLHRLYERTMLLIEQRQAKRKSEENEELRKAAELVKMAEYEGEPYDPIADGFVFTKEEIEEYIHRRDRDERSTDAWCYNNQPENLRFKPQPTQPEELQKSA